MPSLVMLDTMSWCWRKVRSWTTECTPSLLTKFAAEMTGCMVFHFVGSTAPTAAANAVALIVLVYYTAKLSGAHLNPAVTLTFAMLGYTNPVEVVTYWAAQVSGSALGAAWVAALVPGLHAGGDTSTSAVSGCFSPNPAISPVQLLGWEAVCTFCFILPIFSVVWYTQNKSGYGNTGPIMVGLSLFAAASAAGPWTGAALNPARVLGSSVVFSCRGGNSNVPYYIAGELLGASIVPLVIIPYYGISSRMLSEPPSEEEEAPTQRQYSAGAPLRPPALLHVQQQEPQQQEQQVPFHTSRGSDQSGVDALMRQFNFASVSTPPTTLTTSANENVYRCVPARLSLSLSPRNTDGNTEGAISGATDGHRRHSIEVRMV